MRRIIVVEYDPAWPATFDDLRARVWTVVGDLALAIEHIGSTSVPGLAAKPIIDMTVVLPAADDVPQAIERLATLGYVHRGDLGIEGREVLVACWIYRLIICTCARLEAWAYSIRSQSVTTSGPILRWLGPMVI